MELASEYNSMYEAQCAAMLNYVCVCLLLTCYMVDAHINTYAHTHPEPEQSHVYLSVNQPVMT